MVQVHAGGGIVIFALLSIGLVIVISLLAVVGIFKPIIIKVFFEEYPSLEHLTESQVRKICSGVFAAFVVITAYGYFFGDIGSIFGTFTVIAYLSLYSITLSISITGLIFPGIVKRLFVVFGDKTNYSYPIIRIICFFLIIIVVLFGKSLLL